MLLESIAFRNFRALRNAVLPLGQVTVLIGPNGSGKSTALLGLEAGAKPAEFSAAALCSVGVPADAHPSLSFRWTDGRVVDFAWQQRSAVPPHLLHGAQKPADLTNLLAQSRVFAFDPAAIVAPAPLDRLLVPGRHGEGLASVLTSVQDRFPEHFEALNRELRQWLPDFDRILLDTSARKMRIFMLRTSGGRHLIPATSLSEGTVLALALLTLAHLPEPPSIVGIEEPDRGVHPRLLRDVQDAIFRLAQPDAVGSGRRPVQVIMTTHSPYMVDLFRDHPEDIVIATKEGLWGGFQRLTDIPNVDELLRDSHLGEAWYSGAFGGVPAGT